MMLRSLSLVAALAALPVHADVVPVSEGLKVGTAAPQFMLPVVNDFKGGKKWGPARWTAGAPAADAKKLVIMSFFATYCDPCKREMPELARIYDKYQGDGLGIMLVSIDKGDEQKQQIIDLAKASGVTFPVMHDRFQVVARRYAAERLPYMLMLGNDGIVKGVHVGYTDEVKANLENEVRAGLGLELLPAVKADAQPDATVPAALPKKVEG